MTIPDLALAAYAPEDPMLSRIPCLATVVSLANQLATLVVARGAILIAGLANAAWPRANAHSAVQNRGAIIELELLMK